VIFLLSANLDNIPDSPELLNASSKTSVSISFAHLHVTGCAAAESAASGSFSPPAIHIQYFLEACPNFSPAHIARLFHQAADSSPPLSLA
jgi:hypothetical protein